MNNINTLPVSKEDFITSNIFLIEKKSLELLDCINQSISDFFEKSISNKLKGLSFYKLPLPKINLDFSNQKVVIVCSSPFHSISKEIVLINEYSDFSDLNDKLISALDSIYHIVENLSSKNYEIILSFFDKFSNYFPTLVGNTFENELSKYAVFFDKEFSYSFDEDILSEDTFTLNIKFPSLLPSDSIFSEIKSSLTVQITLPFENLNDLDKISKEQFISAFEIGVSHFNIHNHKRLINDRNPQIDIIDSFVDFDSNVLFSIVYKENTKLLRIGQPSFLMIDSAFINSFIYFFVNE